MIATLFITNLPQNREPPVWVVGGMADLSVRLFVQFRPVAVGHETIDDLRLDVCPRHDGIKLDVGTQKRRHSDAIGRICKLGLYIAHVLFPARQLFTKLRLVSPPASKHLLDIRLCMLENIVHVKQVTRLLSPIDGIELRTEHLVELIGGHIARTREPGTFHGKRNLVEAKLGKMLVAVYLDLDSAGDGLYFRQIPQFHDVVVPLALRLLVGDKRWQSKEIAVAIQEYKVLIS